MKYIPHALTVAMIGVILSIRGMFEHSLRINIIGGVLVAFGVIWFYIGWDKLMQHVKAEQKTARRVDSLKRTAKETEDRALDASVKADAAMKEATRPRRQIHGKYNRDGQIIEIRKEA